MQKDRLEISRLYHRFGLGPKPGEFSQALSAGLVKTRENLISRSRISAQPTRELSLKDLGPRPAPNSSTIATFVSEQRRQNEQIVLWWLDQMILADNALAERMVWFWHGHWATSLDKVNHALPMYKQNQTFRKYALGNFNDMAQAMIIDGALQVWLDGDGSSVKAPNENLSRELMELFLLGVNRYSEDDVRNLARALTGYLVERSNGNTVFKAARHDLGVMKILGVSKNFDGASAVQLLASQENCRTFIQERLWYRLFSSSTSIPRGELQKNSFGQYDIFNLVQSLSQSAELSNPDNTIVKSPVEWFVSVCRAFNSLPSTFKSPSKYLAGLDKMAQKPFYPPNVSGWPADEAWLTTASAQYRIAIANGILQESSLDFLAAVDEAKRVDFLADHLGVYAWSVRTYVALTNAKSDPLRLAQLAICSPEYVVNT